MKLYMCKEKSNLNKEKLHKDYSLSFYQKGDKHAWANIMYKTKEFSSVKEALERFENEFSKKEEKLKCTCMFIETKKQEKIATIIAWNGTFNNQEIGRIHWLSVVPEHQGKSLSKYLLYKASELLFQKYDLIYLSTQSKSEKAINLYLNNRFKPCQFNETVEKEWDRIYDNYHDYLKLRDKQL